MIEVGQELPEVRLPDQTGTEVDVAAFRGRPVLIYCYPRDDSPGCTTQACGIRDRWPDFADAGAVVVGISADDVDSHARFAEKFDLPHRLLADPERRVIDRLGAWGWRTRSTGETVEGVLRNTVLVDRDGVIAGIWEAVDPTTHADELLDAIAALPPAGSDSND